MTDDLATVSVYYIRDTAEALCAACWRDVMTYRPRWYQRVAVPAGTRECPYCKSLIAPRPE